MPITPPIFVRADDLYVFDTVEDAESSLEPVDVDPAVRGFDAEGRALSVRAIGEVKKHWIMIDQSRARVVITPAEEIATHVEELRAELVRWLTAVEGAVPTDGLAELVLRAHRHVVGRRR